MEQFNSFITSANDLVWTYVMIALLLGSAIGFSIKTGFVQIRCLKEMILSLFESSETKKSKHHISSFQAFVISLASRVGTGNLAGVATAIVVGGPGAIFWMWIIAIFGAASGFVESTLAQLFKKKEGGHFIGGPAYYMQNGLGMRWMGVLFAIIISITFGLAFNSVQSNTISLALEESFSFDRSTVGVIIAILTGIVIFGGIRRIAVVSSVIVPIMAIGYLILAIYVVVSNISYLPHVFSLIIKSAFGVEPAVGATIGAAIMQGTRRGLFSNEAGMGSAPNAAATAHIAHPVRQGFIQALGVFVDTLIVCSCTAFIILFSHEQFDPSLSGIKLTQAALTSEIGSAGGIFVSIAVLFFAFSSIIGNYYYGEANIAFLTPKKRYLQGYRLLVIGMVMFGSLVSLDIVWNLADLTMAFMAMINIVAILCLGKYATAALNDYLKQKRAGIKNPRFNAKNIPALEKKLDYWHK